MPKFNSPFLDASPYLIASDAMFLLEFLPVLQPSHGRGRAPPCRAAELDRVGGGDGVQPLLHLLRVGPVGRSCFGKLTLKHVLQTASPPPVSSTQVGSLFYRKKDSMCFKSLENIYIRKMFSEVLSSWPNRRSLGNSCSLVYAYEQEKKGI